MPPYIAFPEHGTTHPNMRHATLPAALFALLLASCGGKDDPAPAPAPADPPPVIVNGLILRFVNTEIPTEVFQITYSDADGPGGNDPVVSGDDLLPDRAYTLTLQCRNVAVSPVVDHTAAIAAQGSRYQVFFAPQAIALSVLYSDQDGNARPIGLSNLAIAGSPGLGFLRVELRRDLDKTAAGVAQGDPANAGGEVLFQAMVPVRIAE
jgi:hypothetical protein